MSADYTVTLTSAIPDEDQALAALRISDELDISAATLLRLFVRGRGDITKPIPKPQAERIAEALKRAGVRAEVTRADATMIDDDLPRITVPLNNLDAEPIEVEPVSMRHKSFGDEAADNELSRDEPKSDDEVEIAPEPDIALSASAETTGDASAPDTSSVQAEIDQTRAQPDDDSVETPSVKITQKPLASALSAKADPVPALRERLASAAVRQEENAPVEARSNTARALGLTFLALVIAAVTVLVLVPSLREPLLARFLPSAEARFASGMEAYSLGDYERARASWERLADRGHADAQYQLAWLYNNGLGTERNPAAAARLLEAAAESGHLDAQFDIGSFYREGTGVTQNDRRAFTWFQQAAEAGHTDAQNQLALHYFEGIGVEQDLEEAARLFEDAAEKGSARAMFNIGVLYSSAQGVERDFDQAERWLGRAAEAGVTEALAFLEVVAANKQILAEASEEAPNLTDFNIFRLARFGTADGVIRAVIGGEDILVADRDGQTLLMYAAGANEADVVRELLSGGAEVNVQNKSGWTALMFAARDNPDPEVIEALLEAGADPALTNDEGESVRDIAARHNPELLGLFGSSVQSAN